MEKALLIGVNSGKEQSELLAELEELKELCESCDIEVLDAITQNIQKINHNTYMGSGKIKEIQAWLSGEDCDLIVANDELTPLQIRNLEKTLNVRVYDRTYVILEIFKRRAKTKEAMLQVELASKKYLLPRLVGAHRNLSRQTGSVGGLRGRGGGEMQLELDRRLISKQISAIQNELRELKKLRQTQRKLRKKQEMKIVSLVGYTNSGKSSTLNALLNHSVAKRKEVFEKDMLFATLETSTRHIKTEDNLSFLATDTVGFVNKLPHHLVEAFKSTLEEITEADLILHIVDSSNPNYEKQIAVTNQVLKELGADKIPMIYCFNKSDLLGEDFYIPPLYDKAIKISAKHQHNIDGLLRMIEEELFRDYLPVRLKLPYEKGKLYSKIKENAIIENERAEEDCYLLDAKVSAQLYELVRAYDVEKDRI
ncbi:MAG: GTPase HflX [Bacilli bacterium]|jgi:GTP-binding protein HflX|nr:GTPase HflX [Acholeplasmataceae bacterium]